jgi:glucose-1-phosphate adenylyltransferase
MAGTIAIILAGGQSTRMDVLCYVRPKPVLPFAGIYRVIDFSLSNCIHSHIKHIAVLTDYQRSLMMDYIRSWSLANTSQGSIQIFEPRGSNYLGTADAIYQNLDHLLKSDADIVLVLAADHVYKMDYREMLCLHKKTKADATVGVVPVAIDDAHRFGIVTIDSESRIVDFIEKPSVPQSNLASMGIYAFNKRVLIERLIKDGAQNESLHDFGNSIIPAMVRQGNVFAYRFNGYWRDIGTIEAFYEANMELIRQKPLLGFNGTWPIFTTENNNQSPKRVQQNGIKNSIIGPGCVIKGCVENSILSSGVQVDEQAVIRNSVLMADTIVGYHSVVDYSIVDEQISIGRFSYIGFEASTARDNKSITILGKRVSVPSHTAVIRSCRIQPYTVLTNHHANVITPDNVDSYLTESCVRSVKQRLAVIER